MGDLLRRPALALYTVLPQSSPLAAGPTTRDRTRRPPLRSWAELLSGGVAGFLSQTVAYPLEVIRRRMQVSAVVGDGRRLGIADTARAIWVGNGNGYSRGRVRGFFVGLTIGYVKVVPMVATSFFVYERMKTALGI